MTAAIGKTGFLKNPFRKSKEKYGWVFLTSFVIMVISVLPRTISNGGIFTYYGDFNSQQIMFYQHAHDSVQAGNLGWDWGTDLGSSFVGSYSFYLLGSPFFWLTTIFPSSFVPYMIPWLLALKTAVASVFAYAYIRRFVDDPAACFIGGLLYGCSGFQIYNVFFNHFHDATAFFPILLIGFEKLVQDNKKGAFALAVAINALISYFFFIGECVFLVIYFFLRCTDKEFKITVKKFFRLIFEAVLGVAMGAILFLPACMDILGNPRLTERLWGTDMVFYNENVRIPRIFQAFFMLNDMPARINIFASDRARWASMAGYLPMFSMAGVIGFMRTRRKHWLTRSVYVFMIMACIPILNASFMLFNASYYCRWFYMPILLMCLMTAKVFAENPDDFKKGFWAVLVVDLAMLGVGLLPKEENGKLVFGKIAQYPEYYYIQLIVTLIMLALLAMLLYFFSHKGVKSGIHFLNLSYKRTACLLTAIACGICMFTCVVYGSIQTESPKDYIARGVNGKENMDMDLLEANSLYYNPDNNFYRIDTSPDIDNWCMFWGLSSMRCFHSVVNTSIMDFYTSLGQTRDVASRMETSLYPLRSLLSVKYYFDQHELKAGESPESPGLLTGFKYVGKMNGFRVFENEYYIPMGFAFDKYCKKDDIDGKSDINKTQMLMKALVLDTDTAVKYRDYVKYNSFLPSELSAAAYMKNCNERREECCDKFSYTTNGFDAHIDLSAKKLVFFSVPYDKGWKAQVNGNDVEVLKVDFGLMAIPCEQGSSDIKFTYSMPFLKTGVLLTVGGFAVWGGYVVYFRKKEKPVADGSDDDDDDSGSDTPDGLNPLAVESDEVIDENDADAQESEEEDVLQGENDNL